MAKMNSRFEKFWAENGEMLVWKLWVQKYPDQVQYDDVATMPAVEEVEIGEGVMEGMEGGEGKEQSLVDSGAQDSDGTKTDKTERDSEACLSVTDSSYPVRDTTGDVVSKTTVDNSKAMSGVTNTTNSNDREGLCSSNELANEPSVSGSRRSAEDNSSIAGNEESSCNTWGPHSVMALSLSRMDASGDAHVSVEAAVNNLNNSPCRNEERASSVVFPLPNASGDAPMCSTSSVENEERASNSVFPLPNASRDAPACSTSSVGNEENLPSTHLIGLNQAIQNTLSRRVEGENVSESEQITGEGTEKDENGEERQDGAAASVHMMMHSYAGSSGGKSAHPEGADDREDSNPVSLLFFYSFRTISERRSL
jgi:hypothetical protein